MFLSTKKLTPTYPCAGIGSSLVYSPSLVVLCEYFEKKRSLAFGMATAGASVGAMVVPHIMVLLFEHYGVLGGLLILGAAMYNCCISGAFYMPIAPTIPHQLTSSSSTNRSGPLVFGSPAPVDDSSASAHSSTKIDRHGSHLGASTPTEKVMYVEVATSTKWSRLWEAASVIDRVVDVAIWTDWRFSVFTASQTLVVMSYSPVYMFMPALVEDGGMSEEQAAAVLSTIAAADLVGHVLSAFVFDLPAVRRERYLPFSACIFIMALSLFWMPFITSFEAMLMCAIVYGFSVGIVIAHRNNILCDLLGHDRIYTAVGMMAFALGLGICVIPSTAGRCYSCVEPLFVRCPNMMQLTT